MRLQSVVLILVAAFVACFLAALGYLAWNKNASRKLTRQPQAVAYAKAVAIAQGRDDLQDVVLVGGTVFKAEFSDTCYLIDLAHPALDIEMRC